MRLSTLALATLALVALGGCVQSRRCREARAEARWAAHAYLDSVRIAVKTLEAERDAYRAEAEGAGDGAVAVGDGEGAAEELGRRERALVEWKARLVGVTEAKDALQGGGPIAGTPLVAFAPRDDEANPAGAEAARKAVRQALDVCGRAR